MSNLFVWAYFIQIVLEVPMCKHILEKLDGTGCTEAQTVHKDGCMLFTLCPNKTSLHHQIISQ